jgi:hypothetical protein
MFGLDIGGVNLDVPGFVEKETISGVRVGNLYPADIKDFSQA